MEKFIFLDIDGVIATPETVEEGMWGLTRSKQHLLGKIIHATDAKIVLSSSWRLPTLELTKAYMEEKGFLFTEEIVGVTIRAYHHLKDKVHLSIPRGVEIKQWLDTNCKYPWYAYPDRAKEWEIYDEKGEFVKMNSGKIGVDYIYVILDDDPDMLLEQKDYFLQTKPTIGLTEEIVQKAIEILNQK